MLRSPALILATIINWFLFGLSLYLVFTNPYLISPFVPIEAVVEPVFSHYRSLGKALMGIAVLLLIAAVLNTRFLIKAAHTFNASNLADEIEKPKGRPSELEDDATEVRENEEVTVRQHRKNG